MPRGIPNAKRDETGFRFTTFHVPLAPNPKHMSTTYLKSESQTLWARNALKKSKMQAEEASMSQDQRRGSQVIVIHPGSRYLRVGKASEVTPVTVTNVIARHFASPLPPSTTVHRISRPQKKIRSPSSGEGNEHELIEDPFVAKAASLTSSLRDRMRFYKLRVTPNATSIASTFNEQFKPEIISEYNDPYRIDWITDRSADILIGEEALRLADPQQSGYVVRWPISGTNFNTRDYPSLQVALSDVETILRDALKGMGINPHDYKQYSVILVIPDFYDRAYVREFVNLLLISMGFKQLCVQQESLAATYGAGISNACVVNIGATTTNIACVDEGLVLADTRMSLSVGGDDITEFLYVLLQRIHFPYRDLDLNRAYDWNIMEDLKFKLCKLNEGDVALNLHDFIVRRPDRPTEKYGLRTYDEIILAPMCLFEPKVIEFEQKRKGFVPVSDNNVTEEIIVHHADHVTNAMIISTQHLLPPEQASESNEPTHAKNQAPAENGLQPGSSTPSNQGQQDQGPLGDEAIATAPSKQSSDVAEMVDIEEESKPALPQQPTVKASANANTQKYPGGFPIDVCFEASKLPLDVAIFNSARAAGGDEKIRKYLQAVLVIGGTARIPGMDHALESRLQAIATPLVPNMEKVQIIPPPKEVDRRVLVWKGAAVLGKMDGVADLWITKSDWDVLGMRGLKERCFYL